MSKNRSFETLGYYSVQQRVCVAALITLLLIYCMHGNNSENCSKSWLHLKTIYLSYNKRNSYLKKLAQLYVITILVFISLCIDWSEFTLLWKT